MQQTSVAAVGRFEPWGPWSLFSEAELLLAYWQCAVLLWAQGAVPGVLLGMRVSQPHYKSKACLQGLGVYSLELLSSHPRQLTYLPN